MNCSCAPGLVVRRATANDIPPLAAMLARLSPRSRALRYFSDRPLHGEAGQREAARLVSGPPEHHLALMATTVAISVPTAVAVAELAREGASTTGEIGIVVQDDYQRQGIGMHLVQRLLTIAYDMGIVTLHGTVLAENHAVLRLIERTAVHAVTIRNGREIRVTIDVPDPFHTLIRCRTHARAPG